MYYPIHIPAVWTLCRIVYMHSPRDSTAINIVCAQLYVTKFEFILFGKPLKKAWYQYFSVVKTIKFPENNDLKVGQSLGKALTF